MNIAELGGRSPIVHIVDVHTAFSATILTGYRDVDVVARQIETHWINIHGAPKKISGDPEFLNRKLEKLMEKFAIKIEQRSARRHQKIGTVERKNAVVRPLVQHITKE